MDDPHGDSLPRSLGPYRLLRRIGAGGMAEVHLAAAYGASGFERRVAIKTLLPQLRNNAKLQRLLIEEARLGGRLQHRNLVQVHDLGVADGIYFVRMDYIDGADLASLMRRGLPTAGIALLVAEEIVLALAYLHAATDEAGRPLGLVHRDVSPSNVLLSRAGEVKLGDLGVAKATLLADVTQVNEVKGKYAYLSPEQVAGEPLGARSDQFGLGVTLMEMLCGRRPYDGDTPLATMDLIRAAVPPDLADLDADLAALVQRCLERDPADRFPDDETLRQAIADARRSRPAAPADLARWVGTGSVG
jgi:serine/threonine protein kinase